MSTFDRHLLREWLHMLALVLVACCGLMLVQVLLEDFRQLRELGARGLVFWRYVGVKIPSYVSIALPFALLVSLLYTLGKLHRANELTAMRAAGVGFARLTAPIWVVGIACCGLSWWLNTTVVPWSVEETRALNDELQFRSQHAQALPPDRVGAVFSVAFDNPVDRRMWFFNRYSKATQRAHGVSVSTLDAQGREVARLMASEAWFDAARGGWVFRAGRAREFAPETGELIVDRPFPAERFEPAFHEDPGLMLLVDRKPTSLSLHELRDIVRQLELEHSPKLPLYAVRYFGLIADTLGPLIVIAIAIPFAMTGVRVNPAVGVSKSIGLFVLYWLFNSTATALASKGVLDPLVAAWLPNGGMVVLAIWFLARMR
ncbi:MAG: LptF/LptG family permease [Opitutaceae bacterium]|nr:LptF/LptG family permease [Opitutaceae bacterium]